MAPVRFRGTLDESQNLKDGDNLIDLEEQSKTKSRKKSRSYIMRLFDPPESFFSCEWVPSFWTVTSFAVLFLSVFLVNEKHGSLPESRTLPEGFNAGLAASHLNALIKIGPRSAGSNENEKVAKDLLVNEIQRIRNQSDEKIFLSNVNQVVSGSFYLEMKPLGYANYYDHVQNIVVRLSSSKYQNSSAIVLNCHFDTVPGSPGGGDDGFHCAVMLELLRVLSAKRETLSHDIIFLFNGAEETVLQASHGFITQHEWAKDVKAFINLEGCGAGGREILFQTGPNCPWLVKTYANTAPHPHGSVMAEELFQNNFIPSDTDFRIFRDFGHIPGFDFANIANGFVYHTKFDNGKLIAPGSFQHTGDNVLALVLAMANSSELTSINSSGGSVIYFDLLGVWFLQYSQQFGTILNIAVSILSYFTIFWLLFRFRQGLSPFELSLNFGCAILGVIGGWIISTAYICLLTRFLNWTNLTQSWYQSYFYLISLYYCPATLFSVLFPFLIFYKKSKLSSIQQCQFMFLATQLIWTNTLLLGTILGVRSSYLFLFVVLSPAISNLALMFCRLSNISGLWVKIQLLQMIVPLLMGTYHAILAMSVFVPITNRSGSGFDGELAIGILSAATCFLSISYLIPFSMLIRHVSVVLWIAAIHILGLLLLFVRQPLPFYVWESGESGVLQRVPLWHVERIFHDASGAPRFSDSGFWMMNMDRSSPYHLKKVVPELNSSYNAAALCGSELFCALPLYSPRLANYLNDSIWIPGPKPFKSSIIQMTTKVDSVALRKRRVSFTIVGPPQMSFMFSPLPGVTVSSWSLQADLKPSTTLKTRPAYFIFYHRGLTTSSWTFYVDFLLDKNDLDHIVSVALAGSHTDPEYFSSEFKHFILKFPDWAFISPRASELKLWEI